MLCQTSANKLDWAVLHDRLIVAHSYCFWLMGLPCTRLWVNAQVEGSNGTIVCIRM